LLEFQANGEHFDSDQKMSPSSISHTWDGSGDNTTSLGMTGRVVGGLKRWLDREGGRGRAPAIDDKKDAAPTGASATSGMGSITYSFDDPRVASPPVKDWLYTEIHVSKTSGFTPDDTTFYKRIVATKVPIVGLEPGVAYYVKAIHYDAQGNRGATSNQIAVATQYSAPYHQDPDRGYGVLFPGGDFGSQTNPVTTTPPDNWFESDNLPSSAGGGGVPSGTFDKGVWGPSGDVYIDEAVSRSGG
jgi:hypothetical protein